MQIPHAVPVDEVGVPDMGPSFCFLVLGSVGTVVSQVFATRVCAEATWYKNFVSMPCSLMQGVVHLNVLFL